MVEMSIYRFGVGKRFIVVKADFIEEEKGPEQGDSFQRLLK